MIARQLTYFAAREKDAGRRCDLEAGMAKLLAARVAWACADNALQIHGGNGFALEYPISRVLCDARILSIFEGAAEIQAQVIARRLLEARRRDAGHAWRRARARAYMHSAGSKPRPDRRPRPIAGRPARGDAPRGRDLARQAPAPRRRRGSGR